MWTLDGEPVDHDLPDLARNVAVTGYTFNEKNPVISANGGELDWIGKGSVEFELSLARPSRHYFDVDYLVFLEGGVKQADGDVEPNKTGTLRFRPHDRGYTLAYRSSREELEGKRIQLTLKMQGIGYVDDGDGTFEKAGSFHYTVNGDEEEEMMTTTLTPRIRKTLHRQATAERRPGAQARLHPVKPNRLRDDLVRGAERQR